MLNLRKLCLDKGIAYLEEGHHHCHLGWAQTHCPFCARGKGGFHLGFNLEYGNFNCWRCGKHSVWDVVSSLINTKNKSKIYQTIQQYQIKGLKKQTKKRAATRKRNINYPPETKTLSAQHKKYLRGRGFNPIELETLWELLGTKHLSGEWNWRIIIPIHNLEGQVVAFQGRAISPNVKPKYKMINKEEAAEEPSGLVYGLHKVEGESIIITEGPADVWRVGPGAVALFGTDWTMGQANKLRKFNNRYILFDPEPTAQKKAYELAEWLSAFPGQTEVISGFEKDPGDMTGKELKEVRGLLKN